MFFWVFFAPFSKIGVSSVGCFFDESQNWCFFLGVFFDDFQKLVFFVLVFFLEFSNIGVFFWVFFWVFFSCIFFKWVFGIILNGFKFALIIQFCKTYFKTVEMFSRYKIPSHIIEKLSLFKKFYKMQTHWARPVLVRLTNLLLGNLISLCSAKARLDFELKKNTLSCKKLHQVRPDARAC